MSEKHLINFIKASKHINILDLVKSPVYSDIDSEQYQGFRSKILALTQKFEKYLDREHNLVELPLPAEWSDGKIYGSNTEKG